MPVTNSAIVIDSGSTRNPTFTSKPPTCSQSKRLTTWLRWCSSLAQERAEHHEGGDERAAAREGGQPAGRRLAELAPEHEQDEEAGERERGDEPDEVEGVRSRHQLSPSAR